jgi:phenylacetate-CoA ligase
MLLVKGVSVFPSAIRDLVLTFGSEVTGNVRIVKNTSSPVVEPPVPVKVECRGRPSESELENLKERIEGRVQRQLRFRAAVTIYREGALNVEYGKTGKAKLLEIAG